MLCHLEEAELQNSSCEPTIGAIPQNESTCPSSPRRWGKSSGVPSRFVAVACWTESHADPSQKVAGETIAPEFASWEVGPNGIKVEDLRLAALEQVSAGSWRPLLFYKP